MSVLCFFFGTASQAEMFDPAIMTLYTCMPRIKCQSRTLRLAMCAGAFRSWI